MSVISTASRQWATRPADQRFTSLPALLKRAKAVKADATTRETTTRALELVAMDDNQLRLVHGDDNLGFTHHSFGQLAGRAGAPSQYLRSLPAPLVAQCMNHGLTKHAETEVAMLVSEGELRATTSPKYGRVWDADVVQALIDRFGDGVTGDFRVPGEFGKAVSITKKNTTIYGSDHDMFVFLADETNRIEMPNRRGGKAGSLARGFFTWNSEVGDRSLGVAFFLFDYVCQNRMIWGAQDYEELRIRHSEFAPEKWLASAAPRLIEYSQSSAEPVLKQITAAQATPLGIECSEFLRRRLGMMAWEAEEVMAIHVAEEERPIETLWDATTGITAWAKTIEHADRRTAVERLGGKVLAMATV